MKNLRPLFLLLLFPAFGFAQSLNGVYTGVLSNDSTTIRKDQSFEMALTEYKGKVFGYAYSTFIVNDTLYYIVKRVKGKVEGDICEVEDDEVISHNFPQKPEKKVFVTYTLRRNAADSVWRLDGNWKTNLVQKRRYGYYSISGKVEAKEEKDLSKSKLYEHLGDLDLQKTLAFEKPKEKETKTTKPKEDKDAIAKNSPKKNDNKNVAPQTKVDKKPDALITKADTKTAVDAEKKTDNAVAKTDTKIPDTKTTSTPSNQTIAPNNTVPEKKPEGINTNTKNVDSKTATPVNNPTTQNSNKNVAAVDQKTSPVVVNSQPANVAKTDTKIVENKPVSTPVNNQPKQDVKKDIAATNTNPVNTDAKQPDKKLVSVPVDYRATTNNNNVTKTPPLDKKPETSVAKQENKIPDQKTTPAAADQNEKKDIAASQKKSAAEFEFQDMKRGDRKLKPAAEMVHERITIPSETIFFKSDSISIALYDNGEVDGDSVSVIINDEMFIEKQLLKSSAFRQTYYIPDNAGDSLLVVLFADNLGKYPPNTGLLQIKDGDEIFYVRFRADLDRNAAIVLRRKSK